MNTGLLVFIELILVICANYSAFLDFTLDPKVCKILNFFGYFIKFLKILIKFVNFKKFQNFSNFKKAMKKLHENIPKSHNIKK